MKKSDLFALGTFFCIFWFVFLGAHWVQTGNSKYAFPTIAFLVIAFVCLIALLVAENDRKR